MKLSKSRPMIALVLFATSYCFAQEAPIVQDAYVVGSKPTSNFGTRPVIRVASGGPREGLIQFDLSGFDGEVVEAYSAYLLLPVTGINTVGNFWIRALDSAWSQESVTFDSKPSSSGSISSDRITSGDVGTIKYVQIKFIVNEWLKDPTSNFGLALIANSGAYNFGSIDSGSPIKLSIATRPKSEPRIVWPFTTCHCDSFFKRAIAVYVSLGGTLEQSPEVGSCSEWEEDEPINSGGFSLRRVTGDVSLGLSVNYGGGYDDSCDASVAAPGTDYRRWKLAGRGEGDIGDYDSCLQSIADICPDWENHSN